MAFQPIVDLGRHEIYAHEALVRGLSGEGAAEVLGRVDPVDRFAFHEACRVKAIEIASRLGMKSRLSLNVMPNDVAGRPSASAPPWPPPNAANSPCAS